MLMPAGPDLPQLPEVMTNWHENVTLEILPVHVSQVPQAWDPTQVGNFLLTNNGLHCI